MTTMTPTQLLLQAAIATPEVMTPSGKAVTYEPPMQGDLTGDCWLCGQHGTGVAHKKAIKPTFTDVFLAKAPTSNMVCDACNWSISHRPLRNYSILATPNQLLHPSRAEWRDILTRPPVDVPYIACLAVSGQKWLHFKAMIGYSYAHWQVLLEEMPVQFTPQLLRRLLETVEKLYSGGFSKTEIETGEYQSHRIQAYGMSKWEADEWEIRPYRGSRVFDVALFVAQKKQEEASVERPAV